MKWFHKLQGRLEGLTNAIVRYPLTVLFLMVSAVIVAVSINVQENYEKQLLTCIVGALLCASLQATYERFFNKEVIRFMLVGYGAVMTLGYYLILGAAPELSMEIGIRTAVTLLALSMAFIWVPVIRSRISFNESFMAAFKAFFHAIFYAVVLYAGCSLIIVAIDSLIVKVGNNSFSHVANIIFVLFAPLFFLSLIPIYPGKKNKDMNAAEIKLQDEKMKRASFCPKFLEILISYIIIPLTAVFTVILLLYIIRNIGGAFWNNNLLEPMLVSYAITVILIYILSSSLENKFAVLFRLFFPKVLIPIVLFQIASSIISLRDMGVTHTRYFVILFGFFAVSAGIVMSLVSVQKNGIIAAMLIVFSIVSIIPPVDAFTVSRFSQKNKLKSILIQNEMFKNNKITPSGSISDEDKKRIASLVEYLNMMGYTNNIEWLPDDFHIYEDFYDTFGFYEYDIPDNIDRSVNVFLKTAAPIGITGYDVLTHTYLNSEENMSDKICEIERSGRKYTLQNVKAGETYDIILNDKDNKEMIRFHVDDIFSKYRSYTADKSELSVADGTFSTENDQVKITIVVQNANINVSLNQTHYYADLYILVQFK